MTSWSLMTALLGTYNLVSFRFCCCLSLFEYDNKCDSVYLFSNVLLCTLCIGEARQELIIVEAVNRIHIVHFSTFEVRRHLV